MWFDESVIKPVVGFEGVGFVSGFFGNLWSDIKDIWSAVTGWFDTTSSHPSVTLSVMHRRHKGVFYRLYGAA